jgi:hypothetical protein
MIRCFSNWGEDELLQSTADDDLKAIQIYRFWRQNPKGYNLAKYFRQEDAEALGGSPKKLLIHHNSGGIVLHMLDIFDVINKAHCQLGHLAVDKTHQAMKPMYYSPTQELCKIYYKNCYTCMEKPPVVPPQKGTKNPIILSKFCDHFHVDLSDMSTQRKVDLYGTVQHWIMLQVAKSARRKKQLQSSL